MAQTEDLEQDERQLLIDQINHWAVDQASFIRDVFGVEPDGWQLEAGTALVHNDRISIRSGHGVGKSSWLSWTIIWWLLTRFPSKIPCTAPTAHQLSDVLWGEVAKWVRKMDPALQALLEVKQDQIVLKASPKEGFAVARTARKEQPEAFQGFHADHLLFIVDEASGVDDIIFEVGRGAMSTKGAKTILVGNPTRTSGFFYDTHNRLRSRWYTMRVSCEDSRMVDPGFIEEMEHQYGRDSNIFRVRVLGEFPESEDQQVIPLHLVESARNRDVVQAEGRVIWGLDVARFGDDRTCLVKRKKNWLLEPPLSWKGKDLMQTTGMVVRQYNETPIADRPDIINVDSIGVGAGVVDALRQEGLPVRGISVAERPAVGEKYQRLRDELWWRAREWFEERDCFVPDGCEKLIEELTLPRYDIAPNGKIKVESKADIKKRLPHSPDLADAFCLTFASNDRVISGRLPERDLRMFV